MLTRVACVFSFGALCAGLAMAASFRIEIIAKAGQSVPGVGLIQVVNSVAVNNSGIWLMEVDTDAPTTEDLVLWKGTDPPTVIMQEGQSLLNPAGATISSFGVVRTNINNLGQSALTLSLNGLPSNQDTGIFLNDTLLVQEGSISTAPQLSNGTPFIGFFGALVNDNGKLVVIASVDDPSIATTVDRVLMHIDVATGTQTVIAKEGDILPGQASPVADFATDRDTFALNNNGDVMYVVDTTAATTIDGVVYINSTVVAQEGSPSPVPGPRWNKLGPGTRAGLNSSGSYVLRRPRAREKSSRRCARRP